MRWPARLGQATRCRGLYPLGAAKCPTNLFNRWIFALRYFFRVKGANIDDPDFTGERFSTQEGAKAFAMRIANELAKEADLRGAWVLVTDDTGAEITRVTIGIDETEGDHSSSRPTVASGLKARVARIVTRSY